MNIGTRVYFRYFTDFKIDHVSLWKHDNEKMGTSNTTVFLSESAT